MRISDWSSDVCSSDLGGEKLLRRRRHRFDLGRRDADRRQIDDRERAEREAELGEHGDDRADHAAPQHPVHAERVQDARSEEHTSELQSLMRISYAVLCLKKKIITNTP